MTNMKDILKTFKYKSFLNMFPPRLLFYKENLTIIPDFLDNNIILFGVRKLKNNLEVKIINIYFIININILFIK